MTRSPPRTAKSQFNVPTRRTTSQTGSHKKGAKSINAVSRGYTSPCPFMTKDILKPKVSELISLVLVKTGRTVNKNTLKQDLIKALLNLETRAE